MDSRTSSILLNLDLDLNTNNFVNQYVESKKEVEESQEDGYTKKYTSLRSTIKECYLTGALKYGNNFVM